MNQTKLQLGDLPSAHLDHDGVASHERSADGVDDVVEGPVPPQNTMSYMPRRLLLLVLFYTFFVLFSFMPLRNKNQKETKIKIRFRTHLDHDGVASHDSSADGVDDVVEGPVPGHNGTHNAHRDELHTRRLVERLRQISNEQEQLFSNATHIQTTEEQCGAQV
jgi:hypothetical protein